MNTLKANIVPDINILFQKNVEGARITSWFYLNLTLAFYYNVILAIWCISSHFHAKYNNRTSAIPPKLTHI